MSHEVVLKLAKNTPELPATQRRHLESEARILASIEHPNLARVYDLDCYQDRPFLVMESIKGRTLEQYVRQEKPTPRDCAQTLAKIARGLSAVHRRNIVHLDIKPGNILIDEQNEPRIIDFGLAHTRSRSSITFLRMSGFTSIRLPPPKVALRILSSGGRGMVVGSGAPDEKGIAFAISRSQVPPCFGLR